MSKCKREKDHVKNAFELPFSLTFNTDSPYHGSLYGGLNRDFESADSLIFIQAQKQEHWLLDLLLYFRSHKPLLHTLDLRTNSGHWSIINQVSFLASFPKHSVDVQAAAWS